MSSNVVNSLGFNRGTTTGYNGAPMDLNKDSFLGQIALAFPVDFPVYMTALAQWLMLSIDYQISFPYYCIRSFPYLVQGDILSLKFLVRPTLSEEIFLLQLPPPSNPGIFTCQLFAIPAVHKLSNPPSNGDKKHKNWWSNAQSSNV